MGNGQALFNNGNIDVLAGVPNDNILLGKQLWWDIVLVEGEWGLQAWGGRQAVEYEMP